MKAEAQSFAQDAKTQATQKAEAAKTQVGSTITTFADAIRKAGDELGDRDQTFAARFVREAADGLENFSRALGEKRPEEMLETVRNFGRSNPAAFVAGSVLVGLAVGRFIRSSERSAQPDYGSSYGGGYGGSLGDAELDGGVSLIAAPEANEPIDVDLGDEEPQSLSSGAPDLFGDDQSLEASSDTGIASPAALAEGGDADTQREGENIETGRSGSTTDRGF
ncbi:MAG TPA: hypothetical protein VIO94_05690 [Phenylobacterium sp.]